MIHIPGEAVLANLPEDAPRPKLEAKSPESTILKNDETQVSGLLGNFLLLIKESMKNEFVVESRTV